MCEEEPQWLRLAPPPLFFFSRTFPAGAVFPALASAMAWLRPGSDFLHRWGSSSLSVLWASFAASGLACNFRCVLSGQEDQGRSLDARRAPWHPLDTLAVLVDGCPASRMTKAIATLVSPLPSPFPPSLFGEKCDSDERLRERAMKAASEQVEVAVSSRASKLVELARSCSSVGVVARRMFTPHDLSRNAREMLEVTW